MTKQEICSAISEKAFGWECLEGEEAISKFEEVSKENSSRYHRRRIWIKEGELVACEECGNIPNYFESEDDSARLLEMMRRPLFVSDWPGCEGWRVDAGVNPDMTLKGPTHLDRKTAIVLAFMKWKGIEGEISE